MVDVAGVTQLAGDPEMGAQECRGEFGDQLLGRIFSLVEAALEVAIEAGLMTRPVTIMPISA